MSHRLALLLSVALTFVLAAGILIGRDRFFEAEATSSTVIITPAPAISGASLPIASDARPTSTAPRVIEIPLPAAEQGTLSRQSGEYEGEHERDHHDDDEEGEHDD